MSFNYVEDALSTEVEERLNRKDKTIPFGIDYLDNALIGIAPSDLVIIGAESGAGKTQLCVNVAMSAARQGKRVAYFALEAEDQEITRRLKFDIFQRLFKKRFGRPVGFQDWLFGKTLPHLAELEAQANDEFIKSIRPNTFKVLYKRGDFTVTDMTEQVIKIADETDLIIIDHLHYFDYDDLDDNRAVKHICKTARDLVLEQGKPIILVSHMRKPDPRKQFYTPTKEDFHGSSDIYKIATRAITLGAGEIDATSGLIETYMQVVKNRYDSSVTRFCGRVYYNLDRGIYEKGFEVGKAYQSREKDFESLTGNDRPRYAR